MNRRHSQTHSLLSLPPHLSVHDGAQDYQTGRPAMEASQNCIVPFEWNISIVVKRATIFPPWQGRNFKTLNEALGMGLFNAAMLS